MSSEIEELRKQVKQLRLSVLLVAATTRSLVRDHAEMEHGIDSQEESGERKELRVRRQEDQG